VIDRLTKLRDDLTNSGSRDDEVDAIVEELDERIKKLKPALATARARSNVFTSYALDVRNMFQPRKKTRRGEPELAGNRLDTTCAILGKAASLVAVVVSSGLLQSHAAAAAAQGVTQSLGMKVANNLIPPLALIVQPGWMARDAFRLAFRVVAGGAKGLRDVVNEWAVPGAHQAYQDAKLARNLKAGEEKDDENDDFYHLGLGRTGGLRLSEDELKVGRASYPDGRDAFTHRLNEKEVPTPIRRRYADADPGGRAPAAINMPDRTDDDLGQGSELSKIRIDR
jgi:hypothetical protein